MMRIFSLRSAVSSYYKHLLLLFKKSYQSDTDQLIGPDIQATILLQRWCKLLFLFTLLPLCNDWDSRICSWAAMIPDFSVRLIRTMSWIVPFFYFFGKITVAKISCNGNYLNYMLCYVRCLWAQCKIFLFINYLSLFLPEDRKA